MFATGCHIQEPEGGSFYYLSLHDDDHKCLTGCPEGLVPGVKMMWKNSEDDMEWNTTDQEWTGSMGEK